MAKGAETTSNDLDSYIEGDGVNSCEDGQFERAYLLRCWREKEAECDKSHWRFSLEEILHERPRRGFSSLEALVDFLRAELLED